MRQTVDGCLPSVVNGGEVRSYSICNILFIGLLINSCISMKGVSFLRKLWCCLGESFEAFALTKC